MRYETLGFLRCCRGAFVLLRNTGHGQAASVVELRGRVADKLMTPSISASHPRETILRRVESQITDPVTVDALHRPKMIDQMVLDLRVDGNGLTGASLSEKWTPLAA